MPAWAQGWQGKVLRGGLAALGLEQLQGLPRTQAHCTVVAFGESCCPVPLACQMYPAGCLHMHVLTQLSLRARVPAEGQAWKPVHGRRSLMPWLLPTKEAFLLLEQPEEERLSAPE